MKKAIIICAAAAIVVAGIAAYVRRELYYL